MCCDYVRHAEKGQPLQETLPRGGKKNKSLIPETHTNKSGFVQTGLGPQQRPAWENKEQHQTVGRLVIMPLFLFEHVFVFFHFEIMEYNICADQFSKSAGNGSTAPAQFDS